MQKALTNYGEGLLCELPRVVLQHVPLVVRSNNGGVAHVTQRVLFTHTDAEGQELGIPVNALPAHFQAAHLLVLFHERAAREEHHVRVLRVRPVLLALVEQDPHARDLVCSGVRATAKLSVVRVRSAIPKHVHLVAVPRLPKLQAKRLELPGHSCTVSVQVRLIVGGECGQVAGMEVIVIQAVRRSLSERKPEPRNVMIVARNLVNAHGCLSSWELSIDRSIVL
jgi:hypothetical protein